MTDVELDQLEKLALAATRGPYHHSTDLGQIGEVAGPDGHTFAQVQQGIAAGPDRRQDNERRNRDAAYLAAVHPEVVLCLIASARASKAALRELREAHEALTYAAENPGGNVHGPVPLLHRQGTAVEALSRAIRVLEAAPSTRI